MSTLNRRTLPTVLAAMSARALVQATAPVRPNVGAIWFDTVNGALKVWDGTTWNVAQVDTPGIADGAISTAKVDFTAFDIGGKNITIGAVAPASPHAGDVWFDSTNGYVMKSWSGSAWVAFQWDSGAVAPGSIDTAHVTFSARDLNGITTTFATTAPGSPVTGDLWYDTDNDYQLARWSGSAWVAVQFGTNAVANGAITTGKVNFTARDIGGITTTIAATAPGSPSTGDLWYDSTNGYKLNRWSGSAWVAVQYGTNAISAGSITAALIAANTITAAQIAAGTITANEIAANTITAAKIAAGTITTNEIAANTITAADIAADTITAAQIATGAITANELAANSVTAAAIQAGIISASKLASGIVVAGIVDATTITGAQFVATGTNGEILVYDGTPAAGNLVASVSGHNSIDSFGNRYQAGVNVYRSTTGTGALQLWSSSTAAGPSGSLLADGSGNLGLTTGSGGGNVSIFGANVDITADTGGVVSFGSPTTLVPPGSIIMYGGATAPTGWLLCDGSSVLRSTYANLFAAIGTTYGSVDGTHFTLPNFGSKFPRGNTAGTGGGADTHTHTLSDAGQAQVNMPTTSSVSVRRVATASFNGSREMSGTAVGTPSTGELFGAALAGATDSASNVPAYTGVKFIIKT